LKYFSKIKIIHTIHSPGSSYLKKTKLDLLNNFIEKKLITSKYDIIVTVVSNEIKDVIKRVLNFNGNCSVIPNGVLLPNSNLMKKKLQKKDSYTFIFPARFQESKGHKILLNAFRKLIDDLPSNKFELILVGTELKENLSETITEYELNKHIKIYEPVSDIYEILTKADFGVFPSLYEGHSIALCEMMAIGLPVVATNITSNKYITEEGTGAILCEPNSSIALLDSMKKLIDDINFSNILSAKGQSIINNKFSEKIMFSEYEKIYFELQ
jgi:glycosyltransferase involved in cell wall biosynthesis